MRYFKIFLLLSLISVQLKLFSQYESYFGKDSTVWYVCYNTPGSCSTSPLKITSDTTIDMVNWKILERDFGTTVLFREDTTSGTLYSKNITDTVEYIVSTMNVSKGDSVYYRIYDHWFPIDTVLFDKEIKKRVVYIDKYKPKQPRSGHYFVEGVGFSINILWQDSFSNYFEYHSSVELRCQFKGGVQNYGIKDINYCNQQSGVGVDNSKMYQYEVLLYPNPVKDYLWIKNTALFNSQTQFKVYNLSSQVVKSGNLNGSNLAIKSLLPGVYMLELSDDLGVKHFGKFIKE
ncbi:MAG: hypothetical protein ACJAZ3_000613 [Sphingobacteriales bacterium]|jgi:hypothetical protein